jgi:hypothetical protein
MVGSEGNASFPAIATVLECFKGTLHLGLRELPHSNHCYVRLGLESLRARSLSLEMSNFDIGAEEYACYLKALQRNQTLEFLSMDLQDIEGLQPCFHSLTTLCHENRSLTELRLIGVASSELEGILESVFAGLRHNRFIRTLHVGVTGGVARLSSASLTRLVDVLKVNGVLHAISGLTFPRKVPSAKKARFLLKQNRFGRQLLLERPGPPLSVWSPVLGKISRARARDVMFQFLRTNPRLSKSRRGVIRARTEPHDDDDEEA